MHVYRFLVASSIRIPIHDLTYFQSIYLITNVCVILKFTDFGPVADNEANGKTQKEAKI